MCGFFWKLSPLERKGGVIMTPPLRSVLKKSLRNPLSKRRWGSSTIDFVKILKLIVVTSPANQVMLQLTIGLYSHGFWVISGKN